MRSVGGYAGAGLALVLALTALLWPWLEPGGRRGVLLAGAVAWPVQVVAFGLLVRRREEMKSFLVAWVGGTVVRLGLILVAAFVLVRLDGVAVAPALLALAGFFFGLLLLEPVFFRAAAGDDGADADDGANTTEFGDDSEGT